tara:strand:+ start:207 stop:554 length:348 start_codon:yes stop_codon:yes gene_type:complete
MDKQLLQAKVDELGLTLNSLELNAKATRDDLMEATKKLEDISKPIITKEIVEQIRAAVHHAINGINFNDGSMYEYDVNVGYDNRIEIESIEYNDTDGIEEAVCDYVEDLFNVIED